MGDTTKKCDFCSATSDRVETMFKGYLSAYICDRCVKEMMKIYAQRMIDRMEFQDPLKTTDR